MLPSWLTVFFISLSSIKGAYHGLAVSLFLLIEPRLQVFLYYHLITKNAKNIFTILQKIQRKTGSAQQKMHRACLYDGHINALW